MTRVLVTAAGTSSVGKLLASGIDAKRARATVWTVPVGFVAHLYQASLCPADSAGRSRVAGCTRSRNSRSWTVWAAEDAGSGRVPSRLVMNAQLGSVSAAEPIPTKPPPPLT